MTPKEDALAALAHMGRALADTAPISQLTRMQLSVAVSYALEQVELIEEIKRPRRKKPASA